MLPVLAGGLAACTPAAGDRVTIVHDPPQAAAIPSPPETGSYRVAAIGLDLPDRMAGFLRLGVRRYPDPGLGESVKYAHPRILGADVYIYDVDRTGIGDGIESSLVRREYQDYKQVIERTWPMRPGVGPLSKPEEGVFRHGPVSLLDVRYRSKVNDEDVVTRFLLTGYRGRYVKLRITYPAATERSEPRLVDDFAAALAALLVR